jgi:hypothetical protein
VVLCSRLASQCTKTAAGPSAAVNRSSTSHLKLPCLKIKQAPPRLIKRFILYLLQNCLLYLLIFWPWYIIPSSCQPSRQNRPPEIVCFLLIFSILCNAHCRILNVPNRLKLVPQILIFPIQFFW